MITYQDFLKAKTEADRTTMIRNIIDEYMASDEYLTAKDADAYNAQMNTTIRNYVKILYTVDGQSILDRFSSNNKIASNFFHRLNTQRCTYSLGNGVHFERPETQEKLGSKFNSIFLYAAFDALIHRVNYLFWNVNHIHSFKATEFAPLWDEETGALMAGVRFWQIDSTKPLIAVLYEIDGYTKYKTKDSTGALELTEEKRAYKVTTAKAPVDPEPEVVGEENYSTLPIIPLYATKTKMSTLKGMKASIDAYDLIRSGFANDMQDCAQIYWLVSNAGGMDNEDLSRFLDRLRLQHVANVENADDVNVSPYTQDVPYQSRESFLKEIRSGIYEDYGALDVHTVSAGATNDHIDAAYQPMDENADEFEYCVTDAIEQLLALIGIEDNPTFSRNRISNEKERTEMIIMAANLIDRKTAVSKLPFVTAAEVEEILKSKAEEDFNSFNEEDDE